MSGRDPQRAGRRVSRALAFTGVLVVSSLGSARAEDREAVQAPRFERDVLPILAENCLKCHGPETRKAGLDLRSPALMARGSSNGPVLVKGSAEESVLYEQVSTHAMPPGKAAKLSAAQVETIRAWIDGGAVAERPEPSVAERAGPDPLVSDGERRSWAFLPLARVRRPTVRNPAERVRTPVDAFVLEKLEARGLGLSPEADRVTLVRRACFDLLGLPPTPEQVDAFLADERPGAFERLVDRLLASPQYGERWGRHWLDAAGFSEITAVDNDATIFEVREEFWRYRDYVVRSFNADKPYDRFLTEQVAGDELVDWRNAPRFTPEIQDPLVATGFLRTAVDCTTSPELNKPLERFEVLHGTIENLTSSLLGLTVACARCHDHKFDPIPQRDYYRLMALLTPSYNLQEWTPAKDRFLPDVAPAQQREIDRGNAKIDRQVKALADQESALRRPHEARLFEARLAALPEPIRGDTRAALAVPKDKRSAVQAYLAEKLGPQLKVKADDVARALSSAESAQVAALAGRRAELGRRRRSYGKIQALYEVGAAPATHLLKRGSHLTPGPAVEPGFLAVLGDADLPPGTPPGARRLALARWLTRAGSPACALVARVMVNRVWQHHFGRGLVATPGNFGHMGTPPTHPELLDWLAGEFVRGGWRVKALHKLIMTSAVYRQASHREETLADQAKGVGPDAIDPEDLLLWRMPLRRLEAEAVRDAILAASGALDATEGGPSIPLDPRPDGMVVVDEKHLPTPTAQWRRSVYLLARRNYTLSMLSVFDAPLMTNNCTRRVNSVVPLQALAMMNGAFAWEQAERLARRVAGAAPAPAARQVELAFRLTLTRRPTADEATRGQALLEQQAGRYAQADPKGTPQQAAQKALANLCLMLLNTNEFLYVE